MVTLADLEKFQDAKIKEAERLIKLKREQENKETLNKWRGENIEQEARAIIYGDREKTYGHPAKNIEQIAELWSAYTGTTITADQVCDMMILLKLARLKNNPKHRDSLVDMIGYTLLKERIHEND